MKQCYNFIMNVITMQHLKKKGHGMKTQWRHGLAGLLVLGLMQVGLAVAQPHYKVLNLGNLDLVGIDTDEDTLIALQVVDGQSHGVVLTRTTPPVALPLPEGWQDALPHALLGGLIRGMAQVERPGGPTHAFAGTVAGLVDLGTAGGAAQFSAATCVLVSGATGGFGRSTDDTMLVPLVWPTAQPGAQVLATLGATGGFIAACAGSAYVGASNTPGGAQHATLWQGTPLLPTDLQTLDAQSSLARGINSLPAPEVVGTAFTPLAHPFRWTQATGMELLPLLSGDTFGFANAVNDGGVRVGTSWPEDRFAPPRVVVWLPDGTAVDVQAQLVDSDGWVLTDALAIGPHGVIVARATMDGVGQGVLLVPVNGARTHEPAKDKPKDAPRGPRKR
jgi:hypothetical protein